MFMPRPKRAHTREPVEGGIIEIYIAVKISMPKVRKRAAYVVQRNEEEKIQKKKPGGESKKCVKNRASFRGIVWCGLLV